MRRLAVRSIAWLDLRRENTLMFAYVMIVFRRCIDSPSRESAAWMSQRDQPPAGIVAPIRADHTCLAVDNAFAAEQPNRGFKRDVRRRLLLCNRRRRMND